MQQNEKLKTELQALRKENARLKFELSEACLRPSANELKLLKDDLLLKEEMLNCVYELLNVVPWSYDMVNHNMTGLPHPRRIWTSSLPDSKDAMGAFLSRVHKDDREIFKDYVQNPEKYSKLECKFRFQGDDGNLHYYNYKARSIWDDSGKKVLKAVGLVQEVTEQQRIKKDLCLKEAQLHDAYKLANISVWSYNFETDELNPSEQLRKIWTPPKKNIREALFKRIYPEDRDHLLELMKHPEESSSFDYSCRITGDDNNTYYLLCRCVIEYNEEGKPIKAHGVTWDITEKKLHEKQTLQTENNLRSFFEKIGLGVWEYTVGEDGIFTAEAIRQLTGMKDVNGVVAEKEFLSKIHFQDSERVKIEFEKVVAGENFIYDCIYRFLCKDNQYVWVLSRGVPIFDNKAKVYKVIGSLEELGQSKRYNVMKERFSFMQRIADALPIPVYYKNLKGRYIGFNEAFKEFIASVGSKTSTLIGSTILDVHIAKNMGFGEMIEADEKAFLADPGKKCEKTYVLKTSSGDDRIVVNQKSIVYDSDNNPKFLVGGILDITEQEKIKAEAIIQQEQLLLADKMKSLGILIGGVAHEINNPNNFININVVLLQKMWEDLKPLFYEKIENEPDFKLGNIPGDKLEESVEDLLFGIKDGSERIGKIIDSLKAYIRNAPSDVKNIFSLHDAIENVSFLLKNQMMKATNKFIIGRKSKKLLVKGVQQKIEQVIINVLQNACQALSSREQSIQIETSVDSTGKWAIIKVTDTGVGIESHNLNYITDPFFTTKREIGGTGLGLSISSAILAEHKGRFNFDSKLGKGTVAEIILPLVHNE
jgi:signal transduction histidine kinase